MSRENRYFEQALSDFMFDAASGGAIRHLVDHGHSVDQIMKELDFPTPRERVEKTVYQYMIETGMLLDRLPVCGEELFCKTLKKLSFNELNKQLAGHVQTNGEKNSYMQCPFGYLIKNDSEKLKKEISCLTSREQEYITGIRWERNVMYHSLNSRMLEIGVQLALNSELEVRFFFLEEKLVLSLE